PTLQPLYTAHQLSLPSTQHHAITALPFPPLYSTPIIPPSTQHHAITALPFPPLYSTPIIPPFNPTPRHNCAALSTSIQHTNYPSLQPNTTP
ncbi:hypothetical protein BCR33DRAFT_660513, partial [Rhizoclosmatium globosum]